MNDNIAIKVENVSKNFRLPHEKNTSVKSTVINFYRHNRTYEEQQALKDVSFEVKKGEFFGIVGRNGSGKSTMLKMLAGIYSPSKGSIQVNGKLTPFIELGVGFNPELTGRENVFLNGALLGFNRKEMHKMYKDIVDFAELERFMDQKLKNYSSGMQVRLAFSIAIRARTDILLLDEVLAVGDTIFQQKCFDYFKQLKKEKKTVIFVSHDLGAVREYCNEGILINHGEVISSGPAGTVVNDYVDLLNEIEEQQSAGSHKKSEPKNRWGTGEIKVVKADILNAASNKSQAVFTDKDSYIKIRVHFRAEKHSDKPTYGVTITDASGQTIFQSNTLWSEVQTTPLSANEDIHIEWEVPNIFNNGEFNISPAVANYTGTTMYDWREGLGEFKVRKKLQSSALANIDHALRITEG